MFPPPKPALPPDGPARESGPLIKATGFREYDARWLLDKEINLLGIETLGLGLGTLFRELGVAPHVIVGHDYRSYSEAVKGALIKGLVAAGARVKDIGLALTPMAYYAQFALDVPCVAMVTASHNENGWTGVKMGAARPLTFGPDEIGRLKEIVLGGKAKARAGGACELVPGFAARYMADLTRRPQLTRKLKVVVACGNGTAGTFAPRVLAAIGCEVVPLDCELDWNFPKYNPNTEDLKMLHALRDEVLRAKADVGLAFDGDGDRCGVVDDEGEEIFADKVGVMLARDLSARNKGGTYVVDVKSTGLFLTDPVLKANGAKADYWKTGHSYIKRRVAELKAVAGFEKSGHFFFNAPVGRGYDDGLVAALAVCDMLDRNPGKKMSDLLRANGATTAYWKTGHSYIKRYSHETKSLVGFEKSGHFFFNPPLGRGYDDGLVAALAVCDMLDRNPGKSMADLKNALPKTWQSPTMSPHCDDETKYGVVDRIVAIYQERAAKGDKVAGQHVRELVTVNGVRIVLEDGTWGLVRASSNKPELVIVVESPTSEANMRAIFADIDGLISSKFPEVGPYNQKI